MGNKRTVKKRFRSPRIGEALFRTLLREPERNALLGDHEEMYNEIIQRRGRTAAILWYWIQLLLVGFRTAADSIHGSLMMLKSYLKTAFRMFARSRAYTFINVTGLAIGLACSILIGIYIQYEFSYDTFHQNADQLYRILVNQNHFYQNKNQAAVTPAPLGPALEERFPEVEQMCRIDDGQGFFEWQDRGFHEDKLAFADPDFFRMFDFDLLQGDPNTVLSGPSSLVLSQEMAIKYFGGEDPVGKTMMMDKKHPCTVSGVMKDIPANSHFDFDFIASWGILLAIRGVDRLDRWGNYGYYTFIQLSAETDPNILQEKIGAFFDEHKIDFITGLELQNLKQIHFHDKALFEKGMTADIRSIYIMATIGVSLLLIACFNYINLATARASRRMREIGVRKVVGARRWTLIGQFLGESLGMTSMAFVLAMVLVVILFPSFSAYMQRELSLAYTVKLQNGIWMLALILGVGLFAGLYPALVLSSFQPVSIFRSSSRTSAGRKSAMRTALVAFQFVVTTTLILCTLITQKQISYILHSDLGYDKKNVIMVPIPGAGMDPDVWKRELEQNPGIVAAAMGNQPPTDISNATIIDWEGKDKSQFVPFFQLIMDEKYLDFYQIPVLLGEKLGSHHVLLPGTVALLNETAVKTIGWTDPIGKEITVDDHKMVVIGVVKDFHFASMHIPIGPLILVSDPQYLEMVHLKVDPGRLQETIQFLKNKWDGTASINPFYHAFIEEQWNRMHKPEQRLNQSFQIFAMIALLIACLGLVGLTSHAAERRTKEIGIRKVVGASNLKIIQIMLKDTLNIAVLGTAASIPLGYWLMKRWLHNFTYRIDMSIWIFVLAGLVSLAIAVLTVSYQSIKAAMGNPVRVLTYE